MNSNPPIARLLWNTENGKQELLLRKEDVVTIGRGDLNTIMLDSPRVSRNHARIEWLGDTFSIRDLSSSNGTFVNGQRIEYLPCSLKNGDLIFLERFPMRFEIIEEASDVDDIFALPTVPLTGKTREILRPQLTIVSGLETGRKIIITSKAITIGRESPTATWDVILKDKAVSRPHVKIEYNEGEFLVIDLGSANGTMVNEELVIAPVTLKKGDIVGIGDTKLEFQM